MKPPSDSYEALCARVDALAQLQVTVLNELIETQATASVALACIKTLMAAQGVSLTQKPNPNAAQAWEQLEAECEDAHKFYRTEFAKRVQPPDTPLVESENPETEH